MKKALKIMFLFLVLLISIIGLLYAYSTYIVQPRNAETWVKFIQSDVFEKDSENRGFSDVVKRRLDEKIENEEQRKYYYESAALYRKVLLSKNEDEYFENKINLSKKFHCSFFLMNEKTFDLSEAVIENKKTKILFLHFERERFRSVRMKIIDYLNKNRKRFKSIEDFKERCK